MACFRRRREGEGPSAAAGRRRGGRFEDVEIVGSSEEDNDTSSSDDDCPSDIGWPSGSSEEEMDIDYDDEEFMFARPTRRRSWKSEFMSIISWSSNNLLFIQLIMILS